MLIDGSVDRPTRRTLLAHIRECESCSAAYRDSALLAQIIREDPSAVAVPDDLTELGKTVERRRAARRRRSLVLRLAPVALGALLVVALWPRGGPEGIDPSVLSPIRTAGETATAMGPIVLPGTEAGIGRTVDAHRSGHVPVTRETEASLDRLYEWFLHNDGDDEAAYWLGTGYLVTGQIDLAREVTNLAQTRGFRDVRLETLAGLIAYADKDYVHAETILRRAVEAAPRDPVPQLNLSVVLIRSGRVEEARGLLRDLSAGNTPVASRARELLQGIGG